MCTRDRADLLHRCLTAMERVRAPVEGFDLVVVDNGSIDGTARVLSEHSQALTMHRLYEGRPGKNVALNAALCALGDRVIAADLVVFCDDDIAPDPDWLIALAEAAARHKDVDLFGGRIDIVWTRPPPDWLASFAPFFGILFAQTSCEDGPCAADALWGPNLALRGRLFADGLAFDERFGPNGRQDFAMGSETELLARLGAAGVAARFVAAARVGHMIDGAVLSRHGLLRRAARHGRGVVRRAPETFPGPYIFGVPLSTFRGLLAASLRAAIAREPDRSRAQFGRAWHQGVFGEAFTIAAAPFSLRRPDPRRTNASS